MQGVAYVVNPTTGRRIQVGGPTYNRLLQQGYSAASLQPATNQSRLSKARGCTNAQRNKYPDVPEELFCGTEGGTSCVRSFPCSNPNQCIDALRYKRYAPTPEGIERCVDRITREKGWRNPRTGRISRQPARRRRTGSVTI